MVITGIVKYITYYDDHNGYGIAKIKTPSKRYTVKGTMPGIWIGEHVEIEGEEVIDPKWGKQIDVLHFKEEQPKTEEGIRNYLSDGRIPGIGKTLADRIVAKFGAEAYDIFEYKPDKLLEVNGIGKVKLKKIKKGWKEYHSMHKIMEALAEFHITGSYAYRIYKEYGDESVEIVKTDPYRLAYDIDGIAFKTADMIAQKIGIAKNAYSRIKCGLIYTLKYAAQQEGHCFLFEDQIIKESADSLELDEDIIMKSLLKTVEENVIKQNEDRYYLKSYYWDEINVSEYLSSLMRREVDEWIEPDYSVDNIEYDPIQKEAIRTALNSPVFYITGGPGTGKTTIIKGIIKNLIGEKVILAAPTGRAAKRMTEATGTKAKTIHRLLEADFGSFHKNEENKIEGDVLIVDECSMIDLHLMCSLLKAIPENMHVIFVGDADQIPSVGAGNVLRDIISSQTIPGIKLTKIFRQGHLSEIVSSAHDIINGRKPELNNPIGDEFISLPEQADLIQTENMIADICQNLLPDTYGIPSEDIQVLIPQKTRICGVNSLNEHLQETLNPGKGGIKVDGSTFKKGDKVMQMKNNYEKNVFNGDVGIITDINKEDKEITVSFDDGQNIAVYDQNEAEELKLAYAMTIHKSQGSEYKAVVVLCLNTHKFMLNRNLLYTAVTRAKNLCLIVGNEDTVRYTAWKRESTKRQTTLAERLQERILVRNIS